MSSIDVQVTRGGRIQGGEVVTDAQMVAHCALCKREVEAAALLADTRYACANCLRERLDALSVARFRLRESGSSSLPWGKVTG